MISKNNVLLIVLLFATLSIAGCGAIFHGSKQDITFQTFPGGATVEVFDALNFSYGLCETPCTMELKRKKSYKAIITKPGYEKAELLIDKGTSGWIWGSLLFWGPIGLVIDFTSGAAYKLKPDMLMVTLNQSSQSKLPSIEGSGIVFIDFETLTDSEKEKVLALESFDWKTTKITID